MKRFLKNNVGLGLAEVMLAVALTGGVVMTVMKLTSNAEKAAKRSFAVNDRDQLYSTLNSALGNNQGCMNSLGTVLTLANATNAPITTIKNKNNAVVASAVVGSESKHGALKIKNMLFFGYVASTGMGKLRTRATYKHDANINTEIKPIDLQVSVNFDGTGNLISCSATGSENFWIAMTSPDIGIFYAGGGVLIGTGTANTTNTDPSFSMGESNSVEASGAAALGQNNTLSSTAIFSMALGGKNTINDVYSVATGYDNIIDVTSGAVGSSGPLASTAAGYSNKVYSSESHAIGTGNELYNRFSIAIGNYNSISGVSGIAMGTSNVVSQTDGVAIGTFAEASATRGVGIGTYVRSAAAGAMTLGDNSVTMYSVNSTANSLLARFSGGYKFHSNTAQDENKTLYFNNGYLGVGKATADTNATVGAAVSNATVAMQVTGGITKLAQETWIMAPLGAGWMGMGTSTPTNVAYYKDSTERVHLRGLAHMHTGGHRASGWCAANPGSAIWSATILTLPVGYRPENRETFVAHAATLSASFTVSGYVTVFVTLEPDGDLVYGNQPAIGYGSARDQAICLNELLYISLAQVSFRAYTP